MAGRRRAGRRAAPPRSASADSPHSYRDERAPDGRSRGVTSLTAERPRAAQAPPPSAGLGRALGLTVASALVWGIAHRAAGRRGAGTFLLTAFIVLGLGTGIGAFLLRGDKERIAVDPDWLAGLTVGLLTLALVWATVVLRSYQVVQPSARAAGAGARVLSGTVVILLTIGICSPLVWGARKTYAARDGINSIFQASGPGGQKIDTKDPWKGKPRVNILLLGGDSDKSRTGQGVRTDSVTLASINTKTGDTVLFGIPRNLQKFEMPPDLQPRFPEGFPGESGEGLFNELYNFAEAHPDVVPEVRKKKRRGPEFIKQVTSHLLGVPVDYYVLVDMFGFADIVDAMGGVRIRLKEPMPYGAHGLSLPAGNRKLNGKEALWFGRSRHVSVGDDFARMGRQKCLMQAIAKQADPFTILRRFEKLVQAAKRTLSTDIPQPLLAPLIDLSKKVKSGSEMRNLQFEPPLIGPYQPDVNKLHRLVTKAIGVSDGTIPAPTPKPKGTPKPGGGKPKSLKDSCKAFIG